MGRAALIEKFESCYADARCPSSAPMSSTNTTYIWLFDKDGSNGRRETPTCSFARRIDPLSLTLPPLLGERGNPVVRALKSQVDQLLVELLEAASLLPRFRCLGFEPGGKLKSVWVDGARSLAFCIGWLCDFRA